MPGRSSDGQDERERDRDDEERLGKDEAKDGDRLQAALSLGLACHTADERSEDEADTDTGTDGRQAEADHVD